MSSETMEIQVRICISCGPSTKGSYYCSKCREMFDKLARDLRNANL